MASHGGSLFCSWTCPEQGSHTVGLDGSLFNKEQGGHTFSSEPHGAATAWYPSPMSPCGPPCINHRRLVAAGKDKARLPRKKCHVGRAAAENRGRVHGSSYSKLRPVTASVVCAGRARRPASPLLKCHWSWSWSPFIESPPSSGASARLCRSGRLLALGALQATCKF